MESIRVTTEPSHRWASEPEKSLIESALEVRPDAFGDSQSVRASLYARSEAKDIIQHHQRQFRGGSRLQDLVNWHRGQSIIAIRPLEETHPAMLVGPYSYPHAQCRRREEAKRLRHAMTRLPEKYRQMIQSRDLHELSVAETARSLSLTTAAVKTRRHRKLLVRPLAGAERIPRPC